MKFLSTVDNDKANIDDINIDIGLNPDDYKIETSKSFNDIGDIQIGKLEDIDVEIDLDFASGILNKGTPPSENNSLYNDLLFIPSLDEMEISLGETILPLIVGADDFDESEPIFDDGLDDGVRIKIAVSAFISTNNDTLNYLTNSLKSKQNVVDSKVEMAFGRDKVSTYLNEIIFELYSSKQINNSMTDTQLLKVIRSNYQSDFLSEYDSGMRRDLNTQKRIRSELSDIRRLLIELDAYSNNRIVANSSEVAIAVQQLDNLLGGINYDCSDLNETTCSSLITKIEVDNTIDERNNEMSRRDITISCSNGHSFKIDSLGRLGPNNRILLNLFKCPDCGGYCILPATELDTLKNNIITIDNTHRATDTHSSKSAYLREIPTAYFPLLYRETNEVILSPDRVYIEREKKIYLDKLRSVVNRQEILSCEEWLNASIVSYLAEVSNTTVEELRLFGKSAIYNSHFFRVYVNKGSTLPNVLRNLINKLDNGEPLMFLPDKSDFIEIITMLSGSKVNPTTLLNKTKNGYNLSSAKMKKYLSEIDDVNDYEFPDDYLETQCEHFFKHNVYYDIGNVSFNPYLLYKVLPNVDEIVDRNLLFIISAVSDSVYKLFYPNYNKLGDAAVKLFTREGNTSSSSSSSDDPIINRTLNYDGKLLLANSDVHELYSLLTSGKPFTMEELVKYRDMFSITLLGPMLGALTEDQCMSSTIANGWAMTCLTNACYALIQSMFSKILILDELILHNARNSRSIINGGLLNSLTSVKLVKEFPLPEKYESKLLPYLVSYLSEIETPMELELARYAIGMKAEKLSEDGKIDYSIGIDLPLEFTYNFENEWMQVFVNASEELREMLIEAGIDYSVQLQTLKEGVSNNGRIK